VCAVNLFFSLGPEVKAITLKKDFSFEFNLSSQFVSHIIESFSS